MNAMEILKVDNQKSLLCIIQFLQFVAPLGEQRKKFLSHDIQFSGQMLAVRTTHQFGRLQCKQPLFQLHNLRMIQHFNNIFSSHRCFPLLLCDVTFSDNSSHFRSRLNPADLIILFRRVLEWTSVTVVFDEMMLVFSCRCRSLGDDIRSPCFSFIYLVFFSSFSMEDSPHILLLYL